MIYYRRIEEYVVPGRRLGRNVRHDSESLRYLVRAPSKPIVSVLHDRRVGIFNQGDTGSCVGQATIGQVGTDNLYGALPPDHPDLDEALAIKAYSIATQVDDFPGYYKPGDPNSEDTGSDGLSGAKAAVQLGLASGYLHAVTLQDMKGALQSGPVMVGTVWTAGMDNPDSSGLVHVTGDVRGGHEYEVIGLDVDRQHFRCVQSWGPDWGDHGFFDVTFTDMDQLLHREGDCTQLLPLSVPPPTPAPVDPDVRAWWTEEMQAWARAHHSGSNGKAAKASQKLAKAKGLPV